MTLASSSRGNHHVDRGDRARGPESGDTLLEVLITLMVVSISVVAILLAFTTTISASAKHRSLVSMDNVLTSVAEQAVSQIQQQPNPLFTTCATPASYSGLSFSAPSGYTTTVTSVEYWDGSAFGTVCPSGSTAPQLIALSVSGPLNASSSISFAVQDPDYSTSATLVSLTIETDNNLAQGCCSEYRTPQATKSETPIVILQPLMRPTGTKITYRILIDRKVLLGGTGSPVPLGSPRNELVSL